jgi:hypothetical protein
MPFVGNDNVAEVNVVHYWDGQKVENLLYFFATVVPGDQDLLDLATGVGTYWQTNMLPIMSNQVSMFLVEAVHLTPPPAFTGTWAPSGTITGGDSNAALPNNVTLSVSFRTGLTGRSYRGRNYWLGLTEPEVTNNVVSPSRTAAITAAYAGMMGNDAVVGGWHWGVYSRRHLNADRETGLFTAVTSIVIVDAQVDSQRRRLPGRGR